jgi:hypothetical protein
VLRRFELYTFAPGAPAARCDELELAARGCGRLIPEVRHGATGRPASGAPVDLVWEHAFDSPAAYRRYMAHPYHAAVLDRYLLVDSPERVVADDTLGAGLVGYGCDGPAFAMEHGVRRLVLLRLADDPDAVTALGGVLAGAADEDDAMAVSVFAPNTLGAAWFDGEREVGPPVRWTHLWEQGFASAEALHRYHHGTSAAARLEAGGWAGAGGGVVRRAVEVVYDVRADEPEPGGARGTS